MGPSLADHFHDGILTVGTKKSLFSAAPLDSGGPQIPVPGPLFGEDGVGGAVSLFVGLVKFFQVPDAGDDAGKGVRDCFLHLSHPLFGDMGGAENHIEGLFLPGGGHGPGEQTHPHPCGGEQGGQ